MSSSASPNPDHPSTGLTASDLHDHVAGQLAEKDHRYTAGRRRLVNALASADGPVTLPEIVATDPELAPSSAYRNLDLLERCELIRRMTSGGDHHYFELAEPILGHHHHLICVLCGAIDDVHLDDSLEELVDKNLTAAARAAGYRPLHHSLDVYGHCPQCQEAPSN